jgi:hypothetical protein
MTMRNGDGAEAGIDATIKLNKHNSDVEKRESLYVCSRSVRPSRARCPPMHP